MESTTLSVRNCSLVALPQIPDSRGNLTFVEGQVHIPFDIRRVYYLYDVPSRSERGGHSHRDLWQIIIAVAGSFCVKIDDGNISDIVDLRSPDTGLMIGPGVWRELTNFSSGSVCLVLASSVYTEDDYIRDYSEHVRYFGKA